jgi:hypothetical protein
MIDIKTLLPEVKKLLPGVDDAEIIDGIQQFVKVHPDFNNQQALQALTAYLDQQNQAPQAATPAKPQFQGLMDTLGAR